MDDFLKGMERKGWIFRVPFLRVTNGQRTADLVQFRIPSDIDDDLDLYAGLHGPD